MRRHLTLDHTKQYDEEYSADGGHTWIPTHTHCAATVEACIHQADSHSHPIALIGQIVIIDDGRTLTRWMPRT